MSIATCDQSAGASSVASKTTEPSGLTMRDVRSTNSTPAYGSPPGSVYRLSICTTASSSQPESRRRCAGVYAGGLGTLESPSDGVRKPATGGLLAPAFYRARALRRGRSGPRNPARCGHILRRARRAGPANRITARPRLRPGSLYARERNGLPRRGLLHERRRPRAGLPRGGVRGAPAAGAGADGGRRHRLPLPHLARGDVLGLRLPVRVVPGAVAARSGRPRAASRSTSTTTATSCSTRSARRRWGGSSPAPSTPATSPGRASAAAPSS